MAKPDDKKKPDKKPEARQTPPQFSGSNPPPPSPPAAGKDENKPVILQQLNFYQGLTEFVDSRRITVKQWSALDQQLLKSFGECERNTRGVLSLFNSAREEQLRVTMDGGVTVTAKTDPLNPEYMRTMLQAAVAAKAVNPNGISITAENQEIRYMMLKAAQLAGFRDEPAGPGDNDPGRAPRILTSSSTWLTKPPAGTPPEIVARWKQIDAQMEQVWKSMNDNAARLDAAVTAPAAKAESKAAPAAAPPQPAPPVQTKTAGAPPAVSALPAGKEITNDFYRTSVFSYVTGQEGKLDKLLDKSGHKAVAVHTESDGLKSITMRMPDGSVERWRQTDVFSDPANSAFKATVLVRYNADGKTPYKNEQGQPQVMVVFPGNTSTVKDHEAARTVVGAGDMSKYFDQTHDFTAKVAESLLSRFKGGPQPEITVGMHSMGVFAMGAAAQLREAGFTDVRKVAVEPFGPGEAAQQLAARAAHDTYGDKKLNGQPWSEAEKNQHVRESAQALSADTYMLRSNPPTVFAQEGGNQKFDNSLFGATYSYKPEARLTPYMPQVMSHLGTVIAGSILANPNAVSAGTAANPSHSASEIIDGGGSLSQAAQAQAVSQANDILQIDAAFNRASGALPPAREVHLEENPTDSSFPALPDSAPAPQASSTPPSYTRQAARTPAYGS